MPKVLWKPVDQDTILPIKCGASGRDEFSLYECHYRSRRACQQGAEFCIILQDGQIIARWERLPNGEVQQTAGEVIL